MGIWKKDGMKYNEAKGEINKEGKLRAGSVRETSGMDGEKRKKKKKRKRVPKTERGLEVKFNQPTRSYCCFRKDHKDMDGRREKRRRRELEMGGSSEGQREGGRERRKCVSHDRFVFHSERLTLANPSHAHTHMHTHL